MKQISAVWYKKNNKEGLPIMKLTIKNLLPLMCILLSTSSTMLTMENEKKVYLLFTKENDTLKKDSTEEVPWQYASQFNTIKNMVDDLGGLTSQNNQIPLHVINHNAWVMLDNLINKKIPVNQLSLAGLKDAIAVLHYLDPEPANLKLLFTELLKTYAHELINNKEPYKDALFNVSTLDNMLIKTICKQLAQLYTPTMVLNLKGNTNQVIQELIQQFNQPLNNENIKAQKHLAALVFLQMAHSLNLPLLEDTCIQYLAQYLSSHTAHITKIYKIQVYEKRDKEMQQFVNQLFALSDNLQNKIWRIILLDALSGGSLINEVNNFLQQQITFSYNPNMTPVTIAWSNDSKYLLIHSKNNPYSRNNPTDIRWDIETNEHAHMQVNMQDFIIQGLGEPKKITSITSPNNKYIFSWNNGTTSLLDTTTNQLLERFTSRLGATNIQGWLWSPDSKKIALQDTNYGIIIYLIDDLKQAKQALFALSLPQAYFTIELLKASPGPRPSQFKTWSGSKIVLNKEQEAEFAVLPDALKKMFKSKIATLSPKGFYY